MILVDGDQYAPRDKARQAFHGLGNKAESKAAETLALLGSSDLTVVAVPEYVRADNLERVLRPGDWLFLCVDNHPSRRLVAERCQALDDCVLISGGNEGYDPPRERGTYGNVQIVIRRRGRNVTVPLAHYHPEIAQATGSLPHEAGCGQLISSVPQIVFTNFAVASAMANAFFAVACDALTYQEVKLDILDARMLPQFPVARCGGSPANHSTVQ